MTKFMHLRHTDGKKHSDGKVHPNNHGGMTVAYREVDGGKVEYAVAFCGKHDNFNYRVGRVKAEGRLNSDRLRYTMYPTANNTGTVESRLLRVFANGGLWRGDIWLRQKKAK